MRAAKHLPVILSEAKDPPAKPVHVIRPQRKASMIPRDTDHDAIARWAIDCAERALPIFQQHVPDDPRPRDAIDAVRAWLSGEVRVQHVRERAFAAHAAAREAPTEAARLAARSAGQAAGVPHVTSHAPHAASYARRAIAANGGDPDAELEWQREIATEPVRRFLQAQLEPR